MTLLWLSLGTRWRDARGRSLALVILIAGLGGFVLAAAAAARHVGATYDRFADDTGTPDLVLGPSCERVDSGFGCEQVSDGLSATSSLVQRLSAIEIVTDVRPATVVTPYFVDGNGQPLLATGDDEYGCYDNDRFVSLLASRPGTALDQAIPFQLTGQLPRPGSLDIVMTRATMQRESLAIGDTVRLAGWCSDGDPNLFEQPLDLSISGQSIGPLDIEPPGTGLALEPGYVDSDVIDRLLTAGADPQPNAIVWVDRSASMHDVELALTDFTLAIDFGERRQQFNEALRTDAELLWVLTAVGLIGLILVISPLVGSLVRETGRTTPVLLALGQTRGQVTAHVAAHVATIGAAGAAAAVTLSVPIAAVMPRGLAVEIEPARQLWFDPLVASLGLGLIWIAVALVGAIAGWRLTARDVTSRRRHLGRYTHSLDVVRLGPSARSGVLSAIGAPLGPHQANPWPGLVSLMIAATAWTASATYLAGLEHLQRTPALVGWNWDAALAFNGSDPQSRARAIAEVESVDAVSQAVRATPYPPVFPTLSGTDTPLFPWSFDTGPNAITPTMLAGRAPDGPDEIAISEVLVDQSGLTIGDTITLARPTLMTRLAEEFEHWATDAGFDPAGFGVKIPTPQPVTRSFEITGIAVLPLQRTQVFAQGAFTLGGLAEFAEPSPDEIAEARAWLPAELPEKITEQVELLFSDFDVTTRGAYIRFHGDLANSHAAIDEINAINGVDPAVVPTPEQVLSLTVGLNLTHTDRIPRAVVVMVSIAALLILAFVLPSAIRLRRLELAVMRSVGLTGHGVRRSAAWQATTTAIAPLLVAVPLGIAVGRTAWEAYARDLEVAPEAITPWLAIASLVVGLVVAANACALIPGRLAAKRLLAADLRAG